MDFIRACHRKVYGCCQPDRPATEHVPRADEQGSEPRVTMHENLRGLTEEAIDSSSRPDDNTDWTSQKCEEYERGQRPRGVGINYLVTLEREAWRNESTSDLQDGLVPVCQYGEIRR